MTQNILNNHIYFPGIVGYKNIFENSFSNFLDISKEIQWTEMKPGNENDHQIFQK